MMVILRGLQSPTVETERVKCILHVQPLFQPVTRLFRPPRLPSQEPLTCLALWLKPRCLWMNETIHAITRTSLQRPSYLFSYQAIVIPECFYFFSMLHHIQYHNVFQTLAHNTFYPPGIYFLSQQYFTDCFLINSTKPHGTLDKYKTGQSLHFSL